MENEEIKSVEKKIEAIIRGDNWIQGSPRFIGERVRAFKQLMDIIEGQDKSIVALLNCTNRHYKSLEELHRRYKILRVSTTCISLAVILLAVAILRY